MLPCPVTFTDGYAEISEGENNNVYFICEPIQDSKLQSGYELRILSCPTPYLAMELGVKSGKFYIDDSSVFASFSYRPNTKRGESIIVLYIPELEMMRVLN